MFIEITPKNRKHYLNLMECMFHLRYNVFIQKLGWDLPSNNHLEIDQYDHELAHYIIALNTQGIISCLRLIPTTTRHMTQDIFSALISSHENLISDEIWEASRFLVNTINSHENSNINMVTKNLLIKTLEFCLSRSIKKLVTVSETRVERLLRSHGWVLKRLGSPKRVGGVNVVVGTLDVNQEILEKMQRFFKN